MKLTVRNAGRGSGSSPSASAAPSPGGPAPASAPGASSDSGPLASLHVPGGGGGGGGGGVLGAVYVHVAAAKDGSSLFWAAREGGEPVAVRWRPSDGPWRVTLPLESPTLGLPPPPPPSVDHAAERSGSGGNDAWEDAPRAAGSAAAPSSGASRGAAGQSSQASASSESSPTAGGRAREGDGAGRLKGKGSREAAAAAAAPPHVTGPSITLLLSTDPWVYKDASPPGAAHDSPRPRSLVLQVVEARDLAARDWAGTCDPYVRIAYDSRTYRSRTLYNAHHPVWHQTFILRDNPSLLTRRLSLSVFDSGVSRDDSLGSASLNLDMATEHGLQVGGVGNDRWLPLAGVESGWLRVRLAAVPDAPDSDAVERMVAALEGLTRGSGPLLAVTVLGARALSPRPVDQLLGMRDAYVNVSYGGARHVTHVVKQSQNPRWGYTALFAIPPEEQEAAAAAQELQRGLEAGDGEAPSAVSSLASTDNATDSDEAAVSPSPSSSPPPEQQNQQRHDGSPQGPSRGGARGEDAATRQQQHHSQEQQQQRHAAGGKAVSSIPLPPYPRVPGLDAAQQPPSASASPSYSSQPPAAAASHRSSGHPQPAQPAQPGPRLRQTRGSRSAAGGSGSGGLLRLEVKDVDPVPPDDDLGWAELDVRSLLPGPGDSWSGWLPLRRGEGAELQVHVSRLAPLPVPGEGPFALPGVHPDRVQGLAAAAGAGVGGGGGGGGAGGGSGGPGGGRAGASGASIAIPHSSSRDGAGASGVGGTGASGSGEPAPAPASGSAPAPSVQRMLLDSFTDQVRAGNRSASQVGEDLRVRLGQDVIPKMQDWWDGTLRRTTASLTTPADQMADWLRAGGLSAWVAGASAMAGRPPPPPPQRPTALLSTPAATASTPGMDKRPSPSDGGRQKGQAGAAATAAPQTASASGQSGSPPSGGGDSRREAGGGDGGSSAGAGGKGGGARQGGGGGRGSRESGLRSLVARTWEQLLGPPPALQLQPALKQQQQAQQPEGAEGAEGARGGSGQQAQ
ncbi:hypothetical protein GPECTOR_64g129 [Gonium pectorale]|uniref:C2 domain-containing protein n=1 Tax=Gonium pectorale TaxID=33097 RepID=A0A150G521_GONPE|nr:hypothetical protein GPECTOR_64g129 [Gonium pectorale]|eukprot:KXZ44635.1 hypothetical protein GPECTOR_64g129 [Gonium pectorale]